MANVAINKKMHGKPSKIQNVKNARKKDILLQFVTQKFKGTQTLMIIIF